MLAVLIIMLVMPPFLEKASYYVARGRQRAARDELTELTPTEFSAASRLVAEAIGNSVVYITTRGPDGRTGILAGLNETAGHGSGVIVDDDGYVITNFHVVAGASQILVYLSDGHAVAAQLVGVDEYTDLAVLKIAADALLPAKWGDSDSLEPGDPVWAVGSPFGLDNSVTFGIVSAKGRDGIGRTRYQDLLQTDAAVNPGNSGGALVNSRGELVGINTAIVGRSYSGISFAIPSEMARDVYERLKADGQYARGWLGVQLDKLTPDRAARLGLAEPNGAAVTSVLEGSPAMKAGLRSGDVIVQWQDKAVTDPRSLSFLVAATEPESTAQIVVIRDGAQMNLNVRVGSLPQSVQP